MKLNLTAKVILSLCTVGALAEILLSVNLYRSSVTEAENIVRDQLRVESTLIVDRMDSLIHGVIADMQALGNVPGVKLSMERHLKGDKSPDVFKLANEVFLGFSTGKNAYVGSLGIVDSQGFIVQGLNPAVVGVNVGKQEYFQEALKTNKPVISKPYLGLKTGQPTSVVMAPMFSNEGKLMGFVYTNYDLDAMSKESVDKIRLGKTGRMSVILADGTYLLHTNKDWILKKNLREVTDKTIFFEQESGDLMDRTDAFNRITHFEPMPTTGWKIITYIDRTEIQEQLSVLLSRAILWTAVGLLLLVIGVVVVIRPVVNGLKNSAMFARAVANNDFDKDIDVRRSDELGQLAKSLRDMKESIMGLLRKSDEKAQEAEAKEQQAVTAMKQAEEASRETEVKAKAMLEVAGRLEKVADIVSAASSQLGDQIRHSEQGASEQAARVTETAAAMNEMNSTVMEVARNAADATTVSLETREKATEGSKVVQQSVDGIQRVRQQALTLKEDMAALGEHTQAISQIMGVISDIADQTNLLALNAAIEAARAGEAGRGFAVVADEVRNLAEKTMNSTSDVSNAIRAIQQSASKSIAQVENAVQAVEEATGFAHLSGKALEEIVAMVDVSADQVRSIATASEQQSASSEEINQSIVQVNNIASETATIMQEAARAVEELERQAQALSALIEDLKG